MTAPLVYLASPYSHYDPLVREARFRAAAACCAAMLARGVHVLSPVVYGHPVALAGGHDTDWQTWRDLDLDILWRCDTLAVLTLPGWRESVGVAAEIAEAKRCRMTVEYVDADGNAVEGL